MTRYLSRDRTAVAVAPLAAAAVLGWDAGQAGLLEEVELRLSGNGQFYRRFLLKPGLGSKPSLQARLVAVSLADQVARAFSADEAAWSAR